MIHDDPRTFMMIHDLCVICIYRFLGLTYDAMVVDGCWFLRRGKDLFSMSCGICATYTAAVVTFAEIWHQWDPTYDEWSIIWFMLIRFILWHLEREYSFNCFFADYEVLCRIIMTYSLLVLRVFDVWWCENVEDPSSDDFDWWDPARCNIAWPAF